MKQGRERMIERPADAELMRSLLDSMSEGVLVLDTDFRITFWNAAMERISHTSGTQVIGCRKIAWELFPHLVEQGVDEMMRNAMTGEIVTRDDIPYWLEDGTTGFTSESYRPLLSAEGAIIGVLGVVRDVTDERETRERLRRSEKEKASILGSMTEVVTYQDAEHGVLWGNRAAAESVDRTAADLIGMKCYEVWGGGSECPGCPVAKSYRTREVASCEMDTPDGRIWILHACPVFDETGSIAGVVETALDITGQKRTEEALAESEREFRALFEKSADVVALVDAALVIHRITPSVASILGYDPEKVVGTPILQHVHPDDVPLITQSLSIIEAGGQVPRLEVRLRCADRTWRTLEVATSNHLSDPVISGIVVNARDVSERKRAEEEREAFREQLLRSQKMEAVGRLAGGIAHDFNNLLTAIQGYADLLIRKVDEDDPNATDLNRIHEAAGRAAQLTRQLLLFSRKQPMELAPLDVNATIENLLAMLERLIGEDVSISTDLAGDAWPVRGDDGNIEQILVNLAVNARDAMPGGGSLTIATRNITVAEREAASFQGANPGRYVQLTVRDTGEGMDETTLRRAFEPFFTTKEPGKGTGLGLAVVYGIVEEHGGWVSAESEPGAGTCFTVLIPACLTKPAPRDTAARDAAPRDTAAPERRSLSTLGKGELILLVEDEEAVRNLAAGVLEKSGYVVRQATSVAEATQAFSADPEAFDLIFTDFVLPDGRGPDLASRLRSRRSDLPILMTSGYADLGSDRVAANEGELPLLQKPYSIEDLLVAVRDALEQCSGSA